MINLLSPVIIDIRTFLLKNVVSFLDASTKSVFFIKFLNVGDLSADKSQRGLITVENHWLRS